MSKCLDITSCLIASKCIYEIAGVTFVHPVYASFSYLYCLRFEVFTAKYSLNVKK
jgi:hypothetical protein